MRISDWSSDVCSSDLTRKQPHAAAVINDLPHAHIADRADSADGIECQEPAKELPPPKLHVPIGKRVIDDEVERHRHEDCQGLRISETLSAHTARINQYEQLHQQTDAAHRREHKETHRQKLAENIFEQQN